MLAFNVVSKTIDTFPLCMTKFKLNEYVKVIEPFLTPSMIRREHLRIIKEFFSYFNCGTSNFIGLEIPLGPHKTNRNDFFIAIPSNKLYRLSLHHSIKGKIFSALCKESSAWRKVKKFVKKWIDPSSSLYTNVIGFWFEFGTYDTSLSPNVFFTPVGLEKGISPSDYKWLLDEALPIFVPKFRGSSYEDIVSRCIECLPARSNLFQIGVMLSRPSRDLRMVIKGMERKDIPYYLQEVGWRGDISNVDKLVHDIPSSVSRIVLHFGIGKKSLEPSIGIECSFRPNRFHLEKKWKEIFDYAIERGLCQESEKADLLSFQGICQFNIWDKINLCESMRREAEAIVQSLESVIIRYISHIKFTYKGGNNWKNVKAYIGVRHFLLPKHGLHSYTS